MENNKDVTVKEISINDISAVVKENHYKNLFEKGINYDYDSFEDISDKPKESIFYTALAEDLIPFSLKLKKVYLEDYEDIETIQKKFIVLYTYKYERVISAIANNKNLDYRFIPLSGTYYYCTNTLEEANVLNCFLNSNFVNRQLKKSIKSLRNITSSIFSIPLPMYKRNNKPQVRLGSVGERCFVKIVEFLNSEEFDLKGTENAEVLTQKIIKHINPELKVIDTLLFKINAIPIERKPKPKKTKKKKFDKNRYKPRVYYRYQ